MRSILTAVCLAAVTAFAAPAFAGYIATTGADFSTNTDVDNSNGPSAGDKFDLVGGTFTSYVPQNAGDPMLTGDLNLYRYDIHSILQSYDTNTDVGEYYGLFGVYYDVDNSGGYLAGTDTLILFGTIRVTANFSNPYTASFNGIVTQYAGPTDPSFVDLSYGGNPIYIHGDFFGNANDLGQTGTFSATLVQPMPEPASIALLAMGLPLLMARRRRVA